MKRLGISAVLLLAMCVPSAVATTIRPMSIEEMTQNATDVVEARTLESWSAWNAQRTLIYTYTRVQIQSALKGTSQGVVIVKQLGGHAEGYTQKVSGVRQFRFGEDTVLFLRPSEMHDGTMVIVGLMQGNFRVARSGTNGRIVASNGIERADVMQADGSGISSYHAAAINLSDLETRVRAASTR